MEEEKGREVREKRRAMVRRRSKRDEKVKRSRRGK